MSQVRKKSGRSMPVITSTGELVIDNGDVAENSVEENVNWDQDMSHVEHVNEVTEEEHYDEENEEFAEAEVEEMEQTENALELTELNEDEEGNVSHHNINTGANPVQEDDLKLLEESDDDSDEEIIAQTTKTKESNVLVNLVGRKMTVEDVKYATEMKTKMKEFFRNCSADVSFSVLVHLFIQRLQHPKPIYVLSHDQCPSDLLPDHKYAILCSVKDCENAYFRDGSDWESIEQKKNFFGFPPNPEKCREWILSLGRTKYLTKHINEMQMYRVCEDHFKPEDFTNEYREELNESAVPSWFLNIDNASLPMDLE